MKTLNFTPSKKVMYSYVQLLRAPSNKVLMLVVCLLLTIGNLAAQSTVTIGTDQISRHGTPYWWSVSSRTGFDTRSYAGKFWYTFSNDATDYWGEWKTTISGTQQYEVFVYIPKPDAFDPMPESSYINTYTATGSARYHVYDNDGDDTNDYVTISQYGNNGWISLGKYYFTGTLRVTLGDATSEGKAGKRAIAFDAMKFVPITTPIAKPNLLPFKPASWDDKIIVSNVSGTTTNSSVTTNDDVFVDVAWQNSGDANVSTSFKVLVYLDGVAKFYMSPTSANIGYYGSKSDYNLGKLSAGSHTLKMVVDADNVVSESNESDNEYSRSFTVQNVLPTQYLFVINKTGTGSGLVEINGVTETLPYSRSYNAGTVVSVKAIENSGSIVGGISDGSSSLNNPSYITMNSDKYLTVTFNQAEPTSYTLNINKSGNGVGTVEINGVAETLPFSRAYKTGTVVSLKAIEGTGSTVGSISDGNASLTNPVSITMSANKNITVTFNQATPTTFALNINKEGTGTGTIEVNGIVESLPFSRAYITGTVVSVKAIEATGSTVGGISDGAASLTNPASITMSANKNLTVTFNLVPKPIVAIKTPTSNEKITSAVYKVSGTSSVSGGYIARVEICLNEDGNWKTANNVGGSLANWEVSATLSNSIKSISARATDNKGNISDVVKVNITCDIQSGVFCQCPVYVRQFYNLKPMGNAYQWIYALPNYGYEEVFNPADAEIVVIDKGANNGLKGDGITYGHVARLHNFTSQTMPYTVTLIGSNQGTLNNWTEAGCSNVSYMDYTVNSTTKSFVHYFKRSENGSNIVNAPWESVILTNSASFIGKVKIDDVSADVNDFVGAFVGEECRGVGRIMLDDTGDAFCMFNIQVESKEQVTFKIFDASEDLTYIIKGMLVEPGQSIGTPTEPYELNAYTTISQSIQLKSGWNLISFNLIPQDLLPKTYFESVLQQVIEVKDAFSSFKLENADFFNTLKEIKPGFGYWVKMKADALLEITGQPMEINDGINLSIGWNLIGYPNQTEMKVRDAFEEVISKMLILKNATISFSPTFEDFFNSLLILKPGEGYWLKMSEEILNFNFSAITTKASVTQEDYLDNFNIQIYPNSTVYYLHLPKSVLINEGNYLTAWVGNECRGAGKIVQANSANYSTIVVNGVIPEEVTFKLHDNIGIHSSNTVFKTNPGETIEIKNFDFAASLSVSEKLNAQINLFPNPNDGTINLEMPTNLLVDRIELIDLSGKIVQTFTYSPNGVYVTNLKGYFMVKITTNNGVFTNKVLIK